MRISRHLSRDALVELIETGASHPHVAECDRCRRQLNEAREVLALARADAPSEPSPLFWDRFSARLHEAIEKEPNAGSRPPEVGFARPEWRWVAVAVLAVVAAAVTGRVGPADNRTRQAPFGHVTVVPAATNTATADASASTDALVPAADSSWLVVARVTAHLEVAGAREAGIVLPPDASDRAISELSPSEQQEFLRLLQSDPGGASQ